LKFKKAKLRSIAILSAVFLIVMVTFASSQDSKASEKADVALPVDDGITLIKSGGAVAKDKTDVAKVTVQKETASSGDSIGISYVPYQEYKKGFNITIRFAQGEGWISSFQKWQNVSRPKYVNTGKYANGSDIWTWRDIYDYAWVKYAPAEYDDKTNRFYTYHFDAGDNFSYIPNTDLTSAKYDVMFHSSDKQISDKDTVFIDPIVLGTGNWTFYNTSSAGGAAGGSTSTSFNDVNITTNTGGGAFNWVTALSALNYSIPQTLGTHIEGWAYIATGTDYPIGAMCFVTNWDLAANNGNSGTSSYYTCGLGYSTTNDVQFGYTYEGFILDSQTPNTPSKFSTNITRDRYVHVDMWLNWTHANVTLDEGTATTIHSNQYNIPAVVQVSSGGKVAIPFAYTGGGGSRQIKWKNISVTNVTASAPPADGALVRPVNVSAPIGGVYNLVNVSWTDNQNGTVTYTVTDNGTSNCAATNNLYCQFTPSLQGSHLYNVTASNVSNNSISNSYTYDFHSTAPAFFNNGSNTTSVFVGGQVQLTVNDAYLSTITLEGNFTGAAVNTSLLVGSATVYNATFNKTINLQKGNVTYFKFYINDTVGNRNSTVKQTITVINSPPTASISIPADGQTFSVYNSSFNVSGSDLDNDALTYYWFYNGTFNRTSTTGNITFNFSNGDYKLNVSAYDGAAFSANTTRNFTISLSSAPTSPSFSYAGLNTSTIRKNDYFTFYSNISDAVKLDTIVFGWNGTDSGFLNDTPITVSNLTNITDFESGTIEGWTTYAAVSTLWAAGGSYSLQSQISGLPGDICAGTCSDRYIYKQFDMTKYNQISFDVNITQSTDNAAEFAFQTCTDIQTGDNVPVCIGSSGAIYSNNSNGTFHYTTGLNYNRSMYIYFYSGMGTNQRGRYYIDNINLSNTDNRYRNFTATHQTNLSRGQNFQIYVYANNTAGLQTTQSFSFNVSNTAPVASNVKINNTPIVAQAANVSGDFSDVDNDSRSAVGIQWFIDGKYNSTGDNQSSLMPGNYTGHNSIIGSIRYKDTDWSDWANSTTVVINDTTAPTPSNVTNMTAYTVNDVFQIQINLTDSQSAIQIAIAEVENPNTVKYNVTLTNASLNVAAQTVLYSIGQTATTPVGTWYVKFYYSDSSNNAGMTPDRYIRFTVAAAAGGNTPPPGGGGSSIGDTTTTLVVNGTFSATPPGINSYDFHYGGTGKKTWNIEVTANAAVKSCIALGSFTCQINQDNPTVVKISLPYQMTKDFSTDYKGQITLESTGGSAFNIPADVRVFNAGYAFSFGVSRPSWLWLPSFFFDTSSKNISPRIGFILLIMFLPALWPGIKKMLRSMGIVGSKRSKVAA
jgi:hypothetical protein